MHLPLVPFIEGLGFVQDAAAIIGFVVCLIGIVLFAGSGLEKPRNEAAEIDQMINLQFSGKMIIGGFILLVVGGYALTLVYLYCLAKLLQGIFNGILVLWRKLRNKF